MSSTPARQGDLAFDELEAAISKLVSEHERGQAFERSVVHFLRHDPRLDLAKVWLWADWPARQPRVPQLFAPECLRSGLAEQGTDRRMGSWSAFS